MLAVMMVAALLAGDEAATAKPVRKKEVHPDSIVCKREKLVGSTLRQRICMPQWQWDERRSDDSELLAKAQRNQPGIK